MNIWLQQIIQVLISGIVTASVYAIMGSDFPLSTVFPGSSILPTARSSPGCIFGLVSFFDLFRG